MAKADFAQVLEELDALESELDPIRVLVDEGEETFGHAPTARESAFRQLESAVRHTLGSARALIQETAWESPEEELDVIEILVEEDVVPERIGADILEIAEFTTEELDEHAWESDGLYDRMEKSVDTLSEYIEYVHHVLKGWGE